MRPVRLTLQGFGPYPGRVVIDFRNAVEAGLFGIYGQTGSGKSTIFSAMTFALFGEPAKSEQEAQSLRSDHADPDVATEVEFVFDVGEHRYVVVRQPEQMRPKTRGDGATRSPHEAYLFDATGLPPDGITERSRGRIIAERKVREVDAAIVAMLGYGSQQFRQIVLLPQGRFETFLSAKTPERLDILRELFDVSKYLALMAELKDQAAEAERQVKEERALCTRRLADEGFESEDALASAIAEGEIGLGALATAEGEALAALQASERALRSAEGVDEKFLAAEKANDRLAGIAARRGDMDRLAEQVRRADGARSVVDAESHLHEADRDVAEAQARRTLAQSAAEQAQDASAKAADALRREEERAGEADQLRLRKVELERLGGVLAAAAGIRQEVEAAQHEQDAANAAFEAAKAHLGRLQDARDTGNASLLAERGKEALRAEIGTRRAILQSQVAAARSYEAALSDVRSSRRDVDLHQPVAMAASADAERARVRFEATEKTLAAAQALHLAMKLEPGSPCPVCGATEHPAPATGAIEHAGLDREFREARDRCKAADELDSQQARTLAVLRATLKDRESQLARLPEPEQSAAILAEAILAEERALADLGPGVDIAATSAGLAETDRQLAVTTGQNDTLRERLEECRIRAAEVGARYQGLLAEIPEDLRHDGALAAALQAATAALEARLAARVAAERESSAAREAAVGAAKDLEGADNHLGSCRQRQKKAAEAFASRLAGHDLSVEAFQSLKPAIATIDTDRARVETYQRELASGTDAASDANAAIDGITRPDLQAMRLSHDDLVRRHRQATEAQIHASNRAEHLDRLRSRLADSLRKVAQAEAESAPLRNLALLLDGQNAQRLNLETYAIGAMFDQVLDAANLRLGPMTGDRYRLERDLEGSGRGRRGLGIQVFDIYTGKSRATTTLSGGETFIAALALALGLADVVESASGKVRLDTIFIDEGFGSLDTENGSGTLDQVLNVLNSIVSQNRAVGLISHVPLVQEAIPNGFYVRKGISGSSVEERGFT